MTIGSLAPISDRTRDQERTR